MFAAVAALLLSVSFIATAAHAQYRASIQGTVTDPSGAVVPGATLTLTDKETGRTLTATSNDAGVYNINALKPSTYSITVEKTGFKKKVLDNIGVIAEQANGVDIQLDLGQSNETVTVTGDAAPLIDTETSNLSGTVTYSQLQKLPSIGRDPFQLLQLAPGAFGDGAQSTQGSDLPGTTIGGTSGTDGIFKIENGGQITANGARTGENNYQIDGVGTTSVTWGGTSVITPNEESVKEIKIVTDNYDAENGRYRGAQVQVISQNGTNQYHGSFFFKAHRPGLNAFTKYNGYNSNTPGCDPNPPNFCGNVRDGNRFNDLGGSAGGPIVRNRLFAFFSYERLTNNAVQGSGGAWYATTQFNGLAAGGTNAAAFLSFPGVDPNGGAIVDHTCADINLTEGVNCQFIPGQGLNLGAPLTAPRGTADAGYISNTSPGTGGDGSGGAANLAANPGADIAFFQGTREPSTSSHVQYNGRLDFNATSKDLVAFSVYYVPNSSTGLNGNGDRLMNLFNSTYINRSATLLWNHTFGATAANEARVNAAGWMNKDLVSNPNAPWGLPQVGFSQTGGITVSGYGIGSFNGFDQWTYAGKDVLTKVHGAHTLKMGGEFTRLLSVDAPFWSDRPGYTFNNIWDFLNDAPTSESAQFDPQTGVPSALRKDLRSNIIGVFFQDNYKVRPNLTVTAGLRWEYFGPISEKNGKLGNVVLGTGSHLFTDMHIRAGGNLYHAQKTNFGPQLGFAWSPGGLMGHDFNSRLVVRGGFGMAYNGLVQSNSLDGRFNPPFVSNGQTFSGSQILYIDSFPTDIHNPNGYASNANAIQTFGANNLPITCCTDLTAFPSKWPTTYTYHYTLGAEYDLGHQWVASLGYQGSSTRHLTDHYNLYNPASAAGIPFNPVVHGVTLYADDGSAHFNALLAEARHNFSRSFQLDAQYRWSHNLDSGSNAYAGPFYQWDTATLFATSDYDVRHAFKLYGIWSPTFFHGNSWMEKVAGGWSLSGILNLHGGFPFTPQYGLGSLSGGFDPVFNFGHNSGGSSSDAGSGQVLPIGYNGGFKPNFGSNVGVTGGAQAFFTPPTVVGGTLFDCLFPSPDPVACPLGQQGFGPIPQAPGIARNSFTGPSYFDVDATLSKSFGFPKMPLVGEGAKLEFRANFYNLFNKVNLHGACAWNGLQCDIMDPHFGQSQTALGSRVIEMQARFSF
jgi:hypothetical protein